MLALGMNKAPPVGSEEYRSFKALLEPLTARFITRALKYAIKKFRRFIPAGVDTPRNLAGTSAHGVVAEGIIHEMGHFVTPTRKDHYHVVCEPGDVKKYTDHMILSGKVPEGVNTALGNMWRDIERKMRAICREGVVIPPFEKSSKDAPFHRLLEMLCDQLMMDTPLAFQCLRDRSYLLIPDFLQKLIQLSTHIDLNDPAILQGPSGTGKSYTVMILSELLQLPTSQRRPGFRDLQSAVNVFLRTDKKLGFLFSDNESDVRINGKAVVWGAEHQKPYQNVLDCLDKLVERKNLKGLDYVREGLLECIGPCIKDEASFPDVAKAINDDKKPALKAAVASLFDPKASIEDIRKSIEVLVRELSRISAGSCGSIIRGGFLTLEMAQKMEVRLSSERMRDLAGAAYDDFTKLLSRRHKYEAMQTWACEAVPLVKGQDKAERLCHMVKGKLRDEISRSPILKVAPDLLAELADTGSRGTDRKAMGESLAKTLLRVVDLQREPTTLFVLMRYDMTQQMLFDQMLPTLKRATECPSIRFIVMIDEMNATKMLGLLKRIVVDRYWWKWEEAYPQLQGRIPDNIAFVGGVNPSQKDAKLEGLPDSEGDAQAAAEQRLRFDMTPMPPSLMSHVGHVVPWCQLVEEQRDMFIMRVMKQSHNLFSADIRPNQLQGLSRLLLTAHKFAQARTQNKRSTVSQRDIHRTMKLFDFFFKQGLDFTLDGKSTANVWKRSLSAMLLGIAVSYYFRFPPDERADLSKRLTEVLGLLAKESKDPDIVATESDRGNIAPLARDVSFASIVKKAVLHFCGPSHLVLPEAVYAHTGLLENLFVQTVCFHNRLAVILEGAPGTSKTLSNNIVRDNMTGTGEFWKDFCRISHICRYQGSAQSSAEEIRNKCEEAFQKQREWDEAGAPNKRALLFVDEAGLVRGEGGRHKFALKVLHHYLEGANLACVLMTNATLDPAIGNRCIVVHMAKPAPEELTNMCAGILHRSGMSGLSPEGSKVVSVLCNAFHVLVPAGAEGTQALRVENWNDRYRWWYGLRDLFHVMRYVRRNQEIAGRLEGDTVICMNPKVVARALQRNMNGPTEFFDKALRVYGHALEAEVGPQYSVNALREMLRPNLETILDSIADNSRAQAGVNAKNLNDMWVRFKLIVDTTDDGSMLQLLRQANIPCFKDISVLSLSSLSQGDKMMPVTVVSQIVAAMDTGKTVWLTNTREIDACLFDVFNQNYVVSCSGSNEVNHFAPIAIGAALEYKQVHRDFQCIVHVTKKELAGMGNVLPSPFLNRLEKFSLSVEDIVQYKMDGERMPPDQAAELHELRAKAEQLETSLSLARGGCLFTASPKETVGSLMLEAITEKRLAISKRITSDEVLQDFLFGGNRRTGTWRRMACKMLQVCQLDHMLLAQRVLKDHAPAYLRAFFRDLAPWSLTRHLADLKEQVAQSTSEVLWLRSVVYSPANVDFPAMLEKIPGVRHTPMDQLTASERGRDDLRDGLHHFCLDSTASVFVVVVGPDAMGSAAAREVRLLLDTPPELKEAEQKQLTSKAVVVLQVYRAVSASGTHPCTPLFGTGWDQACIDTSGEHLGFDMKEYVDPVVLGSLPSKVQAGQGWADIGTMVTTAMNTLLSAQLDASKKWAIVKKDDPAAAMYDVRRAAGDQVDVVRKVLTCCKHLRCELVRLSKETVPTHPELVEMAHDVASQEKAQSLPHRLLEEKQKAPVALLVLVLRLLVDDRNASALLFLDNQKDKGVLEQSDKIIAKAVELAAGEMTFHQLRHLKVSAMPSLNVRATKPSLPGSAYLMDCLPVPAAATDAAVEAGSLMEKHVTTTVGQLVDLVHQKEETVFAFFEDCIRARVKHKEARVVLQVVPWVFQLARGLHAQLFGGRKETVWSVRAMCCVEAAAIDDFILAMVPLPAMDVLASSSAEQLVVATDTPVKGSWVSHELGPKLLLQSFEGMSQQDEGLSHFTTACASMLRRATTEAYRESRCLPCLGVVAGLLKEGGTGVVPTAVAFAKACVNVPAPALALDMPELRAALDSFPAAVPHVVLELAKLHQHTGGDHSAVLLPFVLERIAAKGIGRAMCGRILQLVNPNPKEALAGPLPAMMLAAAAPGGVDITVAQETRFHPPCCTADGKQPDTLSKNIAAHESPVYVALYDVFYDVLVGISGGKISASGVVEMARLCNDLGSCPDDAGVAMARKVLLRAAEVAFLQYLACSFQRPVGKDRTWAPSLLEDAENTALVSEVAKALMQPVGFKCPPYNSSESLKLAQQWPDLDCEYNVMIMIHALEAGVGEFRGMGKQAVLSYLQDQVPTDPVSKEPLGALVTVCGEGVKLKCQNSTSLTSAGDLPFISEPSALQFHPYMVLTQRLAECNDSCTRDPTQHILDVVKGWNKDLTLQQKRLVLFYACYKVFFAARITSAFAEELAYSKDLQSMIQLDGKQQHVLHIILDNTKLKERKSGDEVDLIDSLAPGSGDLWSEVMMTALCVASLDPESLLGSCVDDINAQRSHCSPRDETGNMNYDCDDDVTNQFTYTLLPSRFVDSGGIDKTIPNDVLAKKTREEEIAAEHVVQSLWDVACSKRGRMKIQGVGQTAMDLLRFKGQKPNLCRSVEVYANLGRMPAQELPKLLAMVLHEKDKLSLLAPLLCDIYSFAMRVHRMLSCILPMQSVCTEGGGVMRTAYLSVLGLFRDHTPPSQYRMACDQLASIKAKWNQFRDKVGPIEFECEEGRINIHMNEGDTQTGAPGLPDTLDFWVTLADDSDADHKNLIKAALLSLTDKYNTCQRTLQEYTGVELEDAGPGDLNPSKPDLMLREHQGLVEVCRSYADESGNINWCGVETEISYTSGLIIPKLTVASLPDFHFRNEETDASSGVQEQAARDTLALQTTRHCLQPKKQDLQQLRKSVRHFTGEQNLVVLGVLLDTFNDEGLKGEENLGTVLGQRYPDHKVAPILLQHQGLFRTMQVGNLRLVMELFLDKLAVCDWVTSHIADHMQHDIPEATLQTVERAFDLSLKTKGAGDMVQQLGELLQCADQVSQDQQVKDGEDSLHMLLHERVAFFLYEDEELAVHAVHIFKTLQVKHLVSFMRYAKRKVHRLRGTITASQVSQPYHEPDALLPERPYWVSLADLEADVTVSACGSTVSVPSASLGWSLEADKTPSTALRIVKTATGGAVHSAGVPQGCLLMRIDEKRVKTLEDVHSALSSLRCGPAGIFEVSVSEGGRGGMEGRLGRC